MGANNRTITILLVMSFCLLHISCSKQRYDMSGREKYKEMSNNDIVDSLRSYSIISAADFYARYRETYEDLDSIYFDMYIPVFEDFSYHEYKELLPHIMPTPAYFYLLPLQEESRLLLLEDVGQDIEYAEQTAINIIENELIPTIKVELDSIIEKNFQTALNKYSGGILNYRKLAFIGGRNEYDFLRKWSDVNDSKEYYSYIENYTKIFADNVVQSGNEYYLQMVGDESPITWTLSAAPTFIIMLPDSVMKKVRDYTKKEKSELWYSAFRDFIVPVALSYVSGGVSLLYDLGTLAVDGFQIYEDIKNEKLDAETILTYEACDMIFSKAVEDYMHQYEVITKESVDNYYFSLYKTIEENL